MVKSKKTKNIHLTITKKKGIELKNNLVQRIHNYIDTYDRIFVLNYNQKVSTVNLQEMRRYWKPNGRFYFGKNKVAIVALGRAPESEYQNNLHLLCKDINKNICLLFTNSNEQDLLDYIIKSKNLGIDLCLKSVWFKDGSYFNYLKKSNYSEMEIEA